MNRPMSFFRIVLLTIVFTSPLIAGEGMWMLDAINKLPLASMKPNGLQLTAEQIYSANGTSLKDAIVLLGGGTSSFISADGLMMTNHHVAFAGIQSLSSVQDDYLKNGFLASSRAEELSTSYTAQIVRDIRDVTAEVKSALSDTMTPDQRDRAIKAKSTEIEKAAKGTSDLTARVTDVYNGVKYYLFTFETLSDIRLVYAPPGAIGNYGGEVDNWMWPRHTGDFSLMRAYVGPDGKPAKYSKDNVPYHPRAFLPISTKGVSDGSFAMIMGFPGRTFRLRELTGVEVLRDDQMPATIDLYRTRIDVVEARGKLDRGVAIKYASKIRGVENTFKNYQGVLEGMRRSDIVEIKRQQEAAFLKYVNANPAMKAKYGTILDDLAKANAEVKGFARKAVFATNLSTGVDIIRVATRFKQFATAPDHGEKEAAAMREFLAGLFKNYDSAVDKDLLVALILKSAELPASQQFAALKEMYGSKTGSDREKAVRNFVNDLYEDSRITTPEGCEQLLQKDPEKILKDDYIQFIIRIEPEITAVNQQSARVNAYIASLRQKYVEGLIASKQNELTYPDANRTIRFTYGVVKGFSARDAVEYKAVTTLSGVMEKETGEEPFVVPSKLKELWTKKDFGRYADPKLNDVPVAFTSDLDITGGNSGSAVINGNGELIGCAFDGNWEGVVGDYYFQDSLNRTISVDMRYVLFILDKYSNAQNILKELVIR
jgi:hypothetical protein